jgi:hypothetical protein
MLSKNLPRHQRFVVLTQKLILDGLAGIFFLGQGKWRDTLAIIKGHWAFYSSPAALNIHLSAEEGKAKAYALQPSYSIIAQYYLKKVRFFTGLPPLS